MHLRTALEQADAIRRGEVSSEELTRLYLTRIERANHALGAFVEVRPERAMAAARALDRARRARGFVPRGPLWGLPTGLKDLHFTRGFFARMGSRAFRYVWSPVDDVTSAAVRNAGMVIVGKLATSELAILPVVETDLHPPARNPWMLSRAAGGSSGGSAAAIAAGLIPVAPASDGAGSIRIPAAFCGLVGLKTTRALVPNPHARFETVGLSVIGPHARSVDDAAALLDVLTSNSNSNARESFLAAARRPPGEKLLIRTSTKSPVARVEPAVERAVARVASALADLGHAVEDSPALEGNVEEFLPMFQFLVANTPVPFEHVLQPATRWLRGEGKAVSHARALAARELFATRVERWFGRADFWLLPTVYRPAPELGRWKGMPGREVFYEAAPFGGFTAAFNASGHPAITLPVRVEGEDLPLGVQLVGRHGDDGRLLALGRVVLEAMGTPVMPVAEVGG